MWPFRKQIQDESLADQIDDLPEMCRELFLAGEDCDENPGAMGDFGRAVTNPIPVNGPIGEVKYLSRLLLPPASHIWFHRLGSIAVQPNQVDAFEVVASDGAVWELLFLDMYHPRRSRKAPRGFSLRPFDAIASQVAMGPGTTLHCPNFPYDVPEAARTQLGPGLGDSWARSLEAMLKKEGPFVRPAEFSQYCEKVFEEFPLAAFIH